MFRDLKLENFLFDVEGPESTLRMIDFGLSKHFEPGGVLHQTVGTPYTVAPETILGNYDKMADLWSIGVLTFLLLCGDTPFGGACGSSEDMAEVRNKIVSGRFDFQPVEAWDLVSDEGKDFVKSLLTVNPTLRPTAKRALRHPWIQTWAKKDYREDSRLNPKVIEEIIKFKELTDVQKLFSGVLSYTLLPEQVTGLREEFEKMENGEGEITYGKLREVLLEHAESGSLGALTEGEVRDIFQALHIGKSDEPIRWHDFIASGGLSQCSVDDRNLRLCFERLDKAEKGFVTLDDIVVLMGEGGHNDNRSLQLVWDDVTQQPGGGSCRGVLTFADFVLLMKGRGEEMEVSRSSLEEVTSSLANIVPIPEGQVLNAGEDLVKSKASKRRDGKLRSRSLGAEPEKRGSFQSAAAIMDDNQTAPLVEHPTSYPAHQELRLAVLEAIKRFEEKRANHDKATLLVTQEPSSAGKKAPGVVVRDGLLDELENASNLQNASNGHERTPSIRRKTRSC